MHVDLLRVRLDQEIQATVVLELFGVEDAPGAKEGGVLEHVTRELNIEALPTDIPDSIQHDVSEMEIGDTVTLEAVRAPGGVELLDDPRPSSPPSPRRASRSRRRKRSRRRPSSSARARQASAEGEGEAAASEGETAPARRRVGGDVRCPAAAHPSTGWWSGSGTPAPSTRARGTTSASRSRELLATLGAAEAEVEVTADC